ncbi:hypothetical protein [Blastococcus xanthinilyticus]|uniref:Uncharacterized protein n=1 Tax=Blastococcus xanthinilyticus TaxID=1564164 RepID=A0A5S5CPK6_9ACTN|nr:hypothetical protein [Blastococcus xanthinilyticus]TYP82905.1 hypothetical protein BD833_11737 [Blastococcus xanthinilyticus]
MSRPLLPSPAAEARGALPDAEAPAFDRLATAVLARPTAPLGPVLRALLPGTAGIRWLRQEQLAPATRPAALTAAQWGSLYRCWTSTAATPSGRGGASSGGRPSPHGHAPAARAAPRWH